MKVVKTEEMITTESSKENMHTDVQMLRVTWHLTSRYWCIQKRGSFALYNFTHLLGNGWFYCACVNQQWSRLHRTTKIIRFIWNRHFKIQSFNEAIPKYTQADPRRVSDVPKGGGGCKTKSLEGIYVSINNFPGGWGRWLKAKTPVGLFHKATNLLFLPVHSNQLSHIFEANWVCHCYSLLMRLKELIYIKYRRIKMIPSIIKKECREWKEEVFFEVIQS